MVLCHAERLNDMEAKKRTGRHRRKRNIMGPSLRSYKVLCDGNAIFNEIKVCFDCVIKSSLQSIQSRAAMSFCTVPTTLSVLFRMETFRFCISGITKIRPLSLHKNYKCIFRVPLICRFFTDISVINEARYRKSWFH